ncbi:M48 family metalloprotease [Holophaga foetida]|uniref:M48 family metalloprotease n=1 Tax=Holophaga foetida TaxID=35839 RepID=UPI0002473EEF|nr:M48 family metalloprotease [Holophaga foetida]
MNQLKTIFLLGAVSALLIALGAQMGQGWMILAVGAALVMNLGSYYWSDKIVLAMHRAREVSEQEAPQLHAEVTQLAARAGIPKPRICIIPDASPNAFATGRNPAHGVVAFTEGLLDTMPRRELQGVIAHELGHIAHKDILIATVAAAMASAISLLASILQWTAMFSGGSRDDEEGGMNPIAALAFAILAPIGATLIQFAISRSREFLADEEAAHLTGDPEGLARALERLEHSHDVMPAGLTARPATASLMIASPFSGRGVMTWFSTHPPIPVRTAKLRAMIGVR